MRRLARLVVVAGLVLAGGLVLPGGAAQAAACSGSTGVTVVIDKGSSSSTSCAPDTSSAMAALQAVASVTQVQTQPGFICQINAYPNTSCVRTPPASAYWAFFHAARGGSWTYSTSGAGGYDPPTGSVIGFAFGSGGAPSTAPPGATAPKPSPSPSSSSSKPPAPKPSPKPAGTTPARPSSSGTRAGSTPGAGGGSATGASSATGSAVPKPGTTTSASAPGRSTTAPTEGTPSGDSTPSADESADGGGATAAGARSTDSGSPTTLLAGLGLVGLVGAGAAYLAVRRRATG